uniref:toxin C-terminal domain-containing protein n=1 Tax=Cellulomonas sp. TaxID=40001 RepID=UPI0019FB7EAC
TVHNLTVDTDHTYTVVTGGTDVVTHNEKPNMRGAVGRAQDHCNVNPVTTSQAYDIATHLGYTKTKQRSATGAAVWENKKAGAGQPRFITWDRNGHWGGIFKGSDDRNPFQTTSKAGRDGTFDVDIDDIGNLRGLTRVGN